IREGVSSVAVDARPVEGCPRRCDPRAGGRAHGDRGASLHAAARAGSTVEVAPDCVHASSGCAGRAAAVLVPQAGTPSSVERLRTWPLVGQFSPSEVTHGRVADAARTLHSLAHSRHHRCRHSLATPAAICGAGLRTGCCPECGAAPPAIVFTCRGRSRTYELIRRGDAPGASSEAALP